jgi:ATP-dependent exoDNAse (exonuclease V) beta subunit
MTRAKDKLIISGHSTPTSKGEWQAKAWLGDLCAAAQLDADALIQQAGTEMLLHTDSGQILRAWAISGEVGGSTINASAQPSLAEEADLIPLYPSLVEPAAVIISEDEPEESHTWRATGSDETIPPGVVGQMVHKAIELWIFPDNSQLIPLLEAAALNAGLAHPAQRSAAVQHAIGYLTRLQNHPIRNEIESGLQYYHELPYSRLVEDHAETGYIDLLYSTQNGWQIIDFKTDSIRSTSERNELTRKYSRQMRRYAGAVETLIGQKTRTRICFLDDNGRIGLETI